MTDQGGPILIDANVLLEATLKDRAKKTQARQFLEQHRTVLSPLTAHLLIYFGKKDGLLLPVLFRLLRRYSFTEFGAAEVGWAMQHCQGDDFEDALQVACAVLHGCEAIATFDRTLAKRYRAFIKVKVLR